MCIVFGTQMSTTPLPYRAFADGASHYTQNAASAAWVIFSPTDELVSSGGICLFLVTNNVAKYSVVIELLHIFSKTHIDKN